MVCCRVRFFYVFLWYTIQFTAVGAVVAYHLLGLSLATVAAMTAACASNFRIRSSTIDCYHWIVCWTK